jgi:hypothetical protein
MADNQLAFNPAEQTQQQLLQVYELDTSDKVEEFVHILKGEKWNGKEWKSVSNPIVTNEGAEKLGALLSTTLNKIQPNTTYTEEQIRTNMYKLKAKTWVLDFCAHSSEWKFDLKDFTPVFRYLEMNTLGTFNRSTNAITLNAIHQPQTHVYTERQIQPNMQMQPQAEQQQAKKDWHMGF